MPVRDQREDLRALPVFRVVRDVLAGRVRFALFVFFFALLVVLVAFVDAARVAARLRDVFFFAGGRDVESASAFGSCTARS
jgi:hypothetical protein